MVKVYAKFTEDSPKETAYFIRLLGRRYVNFCDFRILDPYTDECGHFLGKDFRVLVIGEVHVDALDELLSDLHNHGLEPILVA